MYLIVVLSAVVFAVIGFFLKDPILIAGTSIMGSYLIMSGIGFFIKDLPSFNDIYKLISSGVFKVLFSLIE